MTAEFLWNLFLRTGLPEAYLLYSQSDSKEVKTSFESSGALHRQRPQSGLALDCIVTKCGQSPHRRDNLSRQL